MHKEKYKTAFLPQSRGIGNADECGLNTKNTTNIRGTKCTEEYKRVSQQIMQIRQI
jgi:hypothetical protein